MGQTGATPMTPERWDRIGSLFAEAAERTGEARKHYLDSTCGDDAELRAELEDLLARHDQSEAVVDKPAAGNLTRRFLEPGRSRRSLPGQI